MHCEVWSKDEFFFHVIVTSWARCICKWHRKGRKTKLIKSWAHGKQFGAWSLEPMPFSDNLITRLTNWFLIQRIIWGTISFKQLDDRCTHDEVDLMNSIMTRDENCLSVTRHDKYLEQEDMSCSTKSSTCIVVWWIWYFCCNIVDACDWKKDA